MSPVPELIAKKENLDCIHCGLCLSACPTYIRNWREADSPRGRIYLIQAVQQGSIELSPIVKEHLDLCLGCRACESACPSGVEFERLLLQGRALVRETFPPTTGERLFRKAAFELLLSHPKRLHRLFAVLRLAQRILPKQRRRAPSTPLLARLMECWAMLPRLEKSTLLEGTFAAIGTHRRKVLFFRGCVMNEIYYPAQLASIDVLRASGCEVTVVASQTCCGALHEHDGDPEAARELAWRNIEAFGKTTTDAIITNSAGCGALLKHYQRLFDPADPKQETARRFSERVVDFSEFLRGEIEHLPLSPLPKKVTYDDPCHLIHGQRIATAPREILRMIPAVDYRELDGASSCCGAAGTYSLMQPELSSLILLDKIQSIAATEAEIVVTANPGCMLQLQRGLREQGSSAEVLHLAEVVARACPSVGRPAPGRRWWSGSETNDAERSGRGFDPGRGGRFEVSDAQ